MHDKLELLLTKINFPETKYFKNGKLEKIICNKNKEKYAFLINLENVLPLDIFLEFDKLLKQTFISAKEVESKFTCENYTEENINNYYKYYLKEYSKSAPLLEAFIDVKPTLEDNNLILKLANKAEQLKFNSIKKELEQKLQNNGFNIKIKTKIDKTRS